MVIIIHTEDILNLLRSISHREVAAIEDPDARYRVEAGTEKMYEINRCVSEAFSRLYSRCSRWTRATYDHKRDNLPADAGLPENYSIEFVLSERRAINKAEGLQEAMQTFMVEYALSKFYSIVSQGELSNKHSLLAVDAGNTIDQILYTKQPPRL